MWIDVKIEKGMFFKFKITSKKNLFNILKNPYRKNEMNSTDLR